MLVSSRCSCEKFSTAHKTTEEVLCLCPEIVSINGEQIRWYSGLSRQLLCIFQKTRNISVSPNCTVSLWKLAFNLCYCNSAGRTTLVDNVLFIIQSIDQISQCRTTHSAGKVAWTWSVPRASWEMNSCPCQRLSSISSSDITGPQYVLHFGFDSLKSEGWYQ